MTVHVRDEELRLGLIESWPLFTAQHEAARMRFVPGTLRLVEDDNMLGGRAGIESGDRLHGVMRVKRSRRLDDGWGRPILRASPFLGLDRTSMNRADGQVDGGAEMSAPDDDRPIHPVTIGSQCRRRPRIGLGCDQDRNNRKRMAGCVEILQIQRVVPHLFDGSYIESLFAHLDLERQDRGTENHDRIDAASHARDAKLEEETTLQTFQGLPEYDDLLQPSVSLTRENRKIRVCSE